MMLNIQEYRSLRLASLFRLSQCKDIRSRLKTCLNLLYDSMLSKLELYYGNCTKLKHFTFVPFRMLWFECIKETKYYTVRLIVSN